MTRRLSQTQYDSSLAGLANYAAVPFNFPIPSHTLNVGNVSSWSSSWPLNNSGAISGVQLNYAGLETVWRPVSGTLVINIPYVGTQYQLETLVYYSGGRVQVVTYVINQTGGSITIPNIIVNVKVFLFTAPF